MFDWLDQYFTIEAVELYERDHTTLNAGPKDELRHLCNTQTKLSPLTG